MTAEISDVSDVQAAGGDAGEALSVLLSCAPVWGVLRPQVLGVVFSSAPRSSVSLRVFLSPRRPDHKCPPRRPRPQVSSSASSPLSSAGLLPSGTERLAALQLFPDSGQSSHALVSNFRPSCQ